MVHAAETSVDFIDRFTIRAVGNLSGGPTLVTAGVCRPRTPCPGPEETRGIRAPCFRPALTHCGKSSWDTTLEPSSRCVSESMPNAYPFNHLARIYKVTVLTSGQYILYISEIQGEYFNQCPPSYQQEDLTPAHVLFKAEKRMSP